jgi:UrcA family protein
MLRRNIFCGSRLFSRTSAPLQGDLRTQSLHLVTVSLVDRTFTTTQQNEEILMKFYTSRVSGMLIAAIVACLPCVGALADTSPPVTVAITVKGDGLVLTRPADAERFYIRLKNAAWVACTRGNRVNLKPVDDEQQCIEDALGAAVHNLKAPLVTRRYLATHSVQTAAAHHIEVPIQSALITH